MIHSDFIYPSESTMKFKVLGGRLTILNTPVEVKSIVAKEIEELQDDPTWKLARDMFKNHDHSGQFLMSPAETEIFKTIFQRKHKRAVIVSSTQYGKTLTISRALLTRISSMPEDWLVTVPDQKRGKLLINYIIKDTSENSYFKKKLIGIKNKSRDALNRLMEERSKAKLTYQVMCEDGIVRYGSVEIISCEAKNVHNAINAVMGFGGKNVVSEESSLISDEIEAGVFRMLAGKGEDTCYIKIGNPFERNHFYRSFKSPGYAKMFINDQIGLADGRYNASFLDEASERPKYDILFKCWFPKEGAKDQYGFAPIFKEDDIENAMVSQLQHFGEKRIGVDVAGEGRDSSVIILRSAVGAEVLWHSNTDDTMEVATEVMKMMKLYSVHATNVFIDTVGVGKGCFDKIRRIYSGINSFKGNFAPETSMNSIDYANLRAQCYWRVYKYIKDGARLVDHTRWEEFLNIKSDTTNDKFKVMGKKQMMKLQIPSPDVCDALMMTFMRKSISKKMIGSAGQAAMDKHLRKKRRKNNQRTSFSGL